MPSPLKPVAASEPDSAPGGPMPVLAEILPIAFYLWFLFQCGILSLVGKAAMQGSHSPGAARAEWAAGNVAFFAGSLVLMLLCGAAAVVVRRKTGLPVPKPVSWLLAIGLFMLLALPFGLFSV